MIINSYRELLKQAVKESGWSMREISRRCKKSGISVSQSYLSKLINDEEIPPASDVVNKALGALLAPVAGIDPDSFLIAAYKVKIPPEILNTLFAEMQKERA